MCGTMVLPVEVDGLTVIVMEPVEEFARMEESVALIDSTYDPAAVGVPVKLHPFSVRPTGTEPLTTAQVYGALPPVIVSAPVYAAFAVAAGGEEIVSVAATVMVTVLVPVFA